MNKNEANKSQEAFDLERKFSEWLELLNSHGCHNEIVSQAAANVHDDIWTAQYIADSRFGARARNNTLLVLQIYDRLVQEKQREKAKIEGSANE